MRTLPPDYLAAEARRWLCRSTRATDPKIIAAALKALARYYEDLVVVRGIVAWRRENL